MNTYKKPELHFDGNPGELSGDEIEKLPDEELSKYLSRDSFQQKKKKYRISQGYLLREIAGEYAIVPVAAETESPLENTVMVPNDSAVFIWKSFEEPSTVDDVVSRGMQEYDIEESALRKAVERFVKESLEYKILEEVK